MTRRRRLFYYLSAGLLILLVAAWIVLASNWSLSIGLRLVSAALPGKLTVVRHEGSLLGPVHLVDLAYHDKRINLALADAKLDWRVLPLLYGKLELTRVTLEKPRIELSQTGTAEGTHNVNPVVLPVAVYVRDARINQLTLRTARAKTPINIDAIHLAGSATGHTVNLSQFDISGYQARAQVSGTLALDQQSDSLLTLQLDYHTPGGTTLHSQGKLTGNLKKLSLRQELSGPVNAILQAQARAITTNLQWQATLQIDKLKPRSLIPTAPLEQLSGKLKAKGNTKKLQASGSLQLVDRALGKADIQLQGESDIALREYRYTATGNMMPTKFKPVSFSVQGKGDRTQLGMDTLSLELLHGKLNGSASIAWKPQPSLHANLKISDLHSEDLDDAWPGRLNGSLVLASRAGNSVLPLGFELRDLNGRLRKQPLKADIHGSWTRQGVIIDRLQAKLGDSQLAAHGQLARAWDLDFEFSSKQLEQLFPASQGSASMKGRLTGSRKAPHVRLQAKASGFYLAHTRSKKLSLDVDMGLASQAPANLVLQIDGMRTRAGHWRSINLTSKGSNAAQQISLQARNNKASVNLHMHGRFAELRWRGALDDFVIKSTRYGQWQLQKTANIELGPGRYHVSKLCVVQNEVHLCTQLRWDSKIREALVDGSALPVALVNAWLPLNLQLEGIINVQGHMEDSARGILQASLTVDSPNKSVRLNFPDSKDQLSLGDVQFQASLDAKGLNAQLAVPLGQGGGIHADASLPRWTPQTGLARNQALKAKLELDNIPADVVTRMIPDMARARGSLHGSLSVNGSLGQPQVRGSAQWNDGSVAVPVLGINVRDIRAQLKSARPNTLMYELQARSGDGELNLTGQTHLQPDRGWPTRVTVSSRNLEVSNLQQAYIVVDSNAKLELQGNRIDIDGDVTIPQARLKPETLPEGAVSASPDIVVIRKRRTLVRKEPWKMTTRLRVQLGDKVQFNGFGIRGKLRGKLVLTDAPGKLVMGQGEVNIADGVYRMRGRDLTIRRGRLIFSNTFIDDPGLDVEAVRMIENITAGVRLKGTLKKPKLTVFSEPTMPETEVLAYLILGHSMSQSTQAEGESVNRTASALGFVAGDYLEKGIGGQLGLDELRVDVNQTTQNTSLVVGKYLSPKLYLRYYNGIAQSSRLIQLQYQLSQRVQIQTESGYQGTQSVTGGDIFFTIEY